MLVAFYLHYIIYIILPVVGPLRSSELPTAMRSAFVTEGGAITHLLRAFVATAEKTPQDGFPSAHTSVATLVAALAWRYRMRSWPVFVGMALAVTSSTIVLGYHYLIDVIAAWPVAWIAWRLSIASRTSAGTRPMDSPRIRP
jgi:membrane-associated phospholipid phosphatase